VGQGNLIGKRLEEKVAPEQIVEELYIRCLTRRPTEEERNSLNAVLAEVEDKKQVLEDVFWALLNSREFVFNH
jgi:hypothetical protein